ncbi:MAG: hypothetical protein OEQ29_19220, partial [Alphaproteobacteria bacterium]|nr:hypothetical protein [Alphaproteobacteria bacterium]
MPPIARHIEGRPPIWSIRNLGYQSYRLTNRPELIIGTVCLAVLGFLVLVPLLEIIRDAFSFQSYDLAYRPEGEV